MTKNEDMKHTSPGVITEESQQPHAHISRAGFFKVAATSAISAAGTLLYMTQPALAAPSANQTSAIRQGKKFFSGIYYIQSALNGFVLTIPNSNPAPGTLVSIYAQNSSLSYNQLWFVSEDGYIQSLQNGFVLEVLGANRSLRTPVALYPKNITPAPSQHWFLSGNYIYTSLDGFVLDISESDPSPGASVIVFSKNSPQSNNQQWTLKPAF